MFNVMNTLCILPFLAGFVFAVGSADAHGTVAGCVWVEDPDIKECILACVPETSGVNVEAGIGFCVGRAM